MKGAVATMAGVSATTSTARAATTRSAKERIRLGMIGTGGQCRFHLSQWSRMPDVEIVVLCDVDPAQLDAAAKVANLTCDREKDYRRVLERKDVDAVCIVTPCHWHAIPAIEACHAGKAVYVEKPIGHNVREGRAIADAARKTNAVVLHGTQQRSGQHWQRAVERIRAGELGDVHMVHAWNAWNPDEMYGSLGSPPDSDPPPGVDYDRWLGPAPKRPFNPRRFHGTFYYFWDYSGGMVSGWGVHLFDVVHWAMGGAFRSVRTVGGKFVHHDMRETPDTIVAAFDCPGYTLHYTMRHGNGWRPHGDLDHGIEFFGTRGTLQINRRGYQLYRLEDRDSSKPHVAEAVQEDDSWLHKRHFLDCIRGEAKPRCDAETGHQASIYGHLANISWRLGRTVNWDAAKETIPGDAEAARLLAREYRAPWHL